MLPITNHKVHIPHAIAFAAALFGLLAALSWDYRSASDTSEPTQAAIITESERDHDQTAKRREPGEAPGQPAAPADGNQWSSSPVMPLFLPSSQGRR